MWHQKLVLNQVHPNIWTNMAAELIKEALRKTKQALNQFPPILEREFFQVDHPTDKTSFRVMQWNVLADGGYILTEYTFGIVAWTST